MAAYSLHGYGEMIADRTRIEAYQAAMTKVVQTGDTVLDLGAGPCLLGLWACQCGAGRVIAVDADSSLGLGREIVRESGFLPRFEFIGDYSTNVRTPVRCDVVVSDLRGVLPLYGRHIPSIVDIRDRWLADSGTLIPQCDLMQSAIVSSQQVYDSHFSGWRKDLNGWSLEPARRRISNSIRKVNLTSQDLLSAPAHWLTLDYRVVSAANHRSTVQWTVEQDGVGQGIAMWFDSELVEGIHISNRPGADHLIYGQMFFPWPEPVRLDTGDTVAVQLGAHLVNDEYIWSWNTRVDKLRTPDSRCLEFRQSTLQGLILSAEQLSRLQLEAPPILLRHGMATQSALFAMDGGASLRDIATKLAMEMPDQFPGVSQAVNFLCSMSGRYWR